MDLPNPKELKALLKVCRDFSVETVEIGTLKIKFGEVTPISDTEADVSAAQPSDDDMVYWSSQPDPLAERLGKEQ